MAQNLTEDLNIVSKSNLVIELLDGDLNIIQALDDEPNDVGGMTPAELKETFDRAGNIIKEYLNGKLIPAILAEDATETARAAAELMREANERKRIENEKGRVSAEEARDSAEKSRSVFEVYSPDKQYEVGNKVTYMGSTFRCIAECKGVPTSDAQYWSVVAAAGVSPTVETMPVSVDGHTGTKVIIKYGDGLSESFIVLNGDGVGDMITSIYDPTSQAQDIFAFAEGFVRKVTSFGEDGKTITETYGNGDRKVTTFSDDGSSITEEWTRGGVLTRKTTTFNADGSITESIS